MVSVLNESECSGLPCKSNQDSQEEVSKTDNRCWKRERP